MAELWERPRISSCSPLCYFVCLEFILVWEVKFFFWTFILHPFKETKSFSFSWKTFEVSRYCERLTSLESLNTSFCPQTSFGGILGVETLCSSAAVPINARAPIMVLNILHVTLYPQKDRHSCLILTTSVCPGSTEKPTKPLLQGGLRTNSPSHHHPMPRCPQREATQYTESNAICSAGGLDLGLGFLS